MHDSLTHVHDSTLDVGVPYESALAPPHPPPCPSAAARVAAIHELADAALHALASAAVSKVLAQTNEPAAVQVAMSAALATALAELRAFERAVYDKLRTIDAMGSIGERAAPPGPPEPGR